MIQCARTFSVLLLTALIAPFMHHANLAFADALVVTKAMQASTVLEIFVDPDQIRLEMEVGERDLEAFLNILPNDVHEKLTGTSQPLAERLKAFVSSDWQLRSDGQLLPGSVTKLAVQRRIVRDEVTGEPLAIQPADVESVIRINVGYALAEQPKSVSITPPMSEGYVAANIGFVCYHNGLPVNDFRYLPGEVTLDLDWEDPWYSKFRNRNLRRQFNAPLSAYLYVEPYEVRKEIIVRPKDLETWIDLGLDEEGKIPVAKQEQLKRDVADFLTDRNPLTVDGRAVTGRLDRIHFVRRTLRTTGIIEPAVEMDSNSATLGIIFVYPIESLPQNVAMRWELFSPKIQAIPAVASDEAGGLPAEITPASPVLQWSNYLTNPTSPELQAVDQTPLRQALRIPLLSLLCGCIAIVSAGRLLKQKWSSSILSKPSLILLTIATVGGLALLPVARISVPNPFSSNPQLSETEARELLSALLYNVYRSFDHHDESLIYDRLSQSIAGELLSEVYLETRKSMEVKNQGGLRVSVKEVDVTDIRLVDISAAGSNFECRWRVSGWIGHWGHVHRRLNEHVARVRVEPREQRWKITAMEVLDEQSLQTPIRPDSKVSSEVTNERIRETGTGV